MLRLIADTRDLPGRLWSAVGVTAIGGCGGLLLALALASRLQTSIIEPSGRRRQFGQSRSRQSGLARFGVIPRLVENGREAVEAHAAAEWYLILMDGSMPELDGFEAARAIPVHARPLSR